MRLRVLWTGVLALALALPATALAGRGSRVDWSQYIDKDAGKDPPSASNTTASKTKSKAKAKATKKRAKKTNKRGMRARGKKIRGKR